MGLMGLLFNFALQCFHIFAWPALALGYPLCASIQAIETNSNLDTRKLITYWVCLSLILLFDHAFHWLTYWPYVKLIIVGCLVIPRFNGSFYIYNHLVRPSLSINPHIVFNWFIEMLEIILKEDNPLIETKKDVKETEPQALQNLIASKEGKVERPKVETKDIIAEKIKEKDELSVTDPVTQTEPGFALPERDLYDLMAGNKKPQNEWTCAVCQVTTTSEADLISHLQGKKHADEFDRVKPKEQANNVPLPNSGQTSAETLDSQTSQTIWTCVLCKVKCGRKFDLISHFQGKPHLKALESLKAKPTAKFYFRPWTCEICKTKLKNKNDLVLHLESKRHSTACENQKMEIKKAVQDEVCSVSSENNSNLASTEFKEAMNPKIQNPENWSVVEAKGCNLWCSVCSIWCSGEGNMNQHLSGSKHLAKVMELSGGVVAANGQPPYCSCGDC